MKLMNRLLSFFILLFLISKSVNIMNAQQVWDDGIAHRYFFSSVTNNLERNFKQERLETEIPTTIEKELAVLKSVYNRKLLERISRNLLEKNINKEALRNFYESYPDVGAILLNRGNQFPTDDSEEEKSKMNSLLVEIWKKIPNAEFNILSARTDEITRQKILMTFPYQLYLFENYLEDSSRKRNHVINYLLWTY